MKKYRKKIKLKWPAYVLIFLLIFALGFVIFLNLSKKFNSFEYKLEQKNYTQKEITKLKVLNEESRNYILQKNKLELYIEIIDQKYFLKELFLEYIEYNKDIELDLSDLIAYVNTSSYEEDYVNINKTDISKGSLMLVNKNNYLEPTYSPTDLKPVSNWYAYEGRKLSDVAYQAYITMFNSAKEEGLSLILANGYKSYKDSEILFNNYKRDFGQRAADSMTSRPGFSEYQTGLALNIDKFYSTKKFETTDEYKWLIENSYKYGFILRYPEGKQFITKYGFIPTHFRYVGIEASTKITDENLTLEEYYAYYLR